MKEYEGILRNMEKYEGIWRNMKEWMNGGWLYSTEAWWAAVGLAGWLAVLGEPTLNAVRFHCRRLRSVAECA